MKRVFVFLLCLFFVSDELSRGRRASSVGFVRSRKCTIESP